jgi:perosamine synthetase
VKSIPLSQPLIGWREVFSAGRAIKSGWLTQNGSQVKLMENTISAAFSTSTFKFEVTTTSNGTHSLHLALLSLGIKDGDYVAIPNFCYVAVANSVLYCGATPILVEVNEETTNIDLETLPHDLLSKIKAVIVVDNYGIQNDLKAIRKIIGPEIPIIYDVAESFPECAEAVNRTSEADLITGSFYANKVFTSGEGGFIGGKRELVDKIRKMKNQGQSRAGEFAHDMVGFNYRITNIQAAVFNAQWTRSKRILRRRRKIFEKYAFELGKNTQLKFINQHENPWLVAVRILGSQIPIEEVRSKLTAKGIETRPGFQSFDSVGYITEKSLKSSTLSKSHVLAKQIICLPTFPKLRNREITYICRELDQILNDHGKSSTRLH